MWVFLSEFSRCILALTNQPGLRLGSGWLGADGVSMECCVCPCSVFVCSSASTEMSGTPENCTAQ